MQDDHFHKLHRLLGAGLLDEALERIYDEQSDGINPLYTDDPNHAWYIVGDIRFRQGDYPKAIAAFLAAVEFRADDVDGRMALANAYSENNEPNNAETVLKTALAIEPGNDDLLFNLGNALYDQEKYTGAIEVFKLVTEKNAETASAAKKNLELAQRHQKDVEPNK